MVGLHWGWALRSFVGTNRNGIYQVLVFVSSVCGAGIPILPKLFSIEGTGRTLAIAIGIILHLGLRRWTGALQVSQTMMAGLRPRSIVRIGLAE